MSLIVVESPTKARTFNRILKAKKLDDEYFVFATIGHFRDLPAATIAIDFEHDFEPQYEVMDRKAEMVSQLKELASKHKKIILATDLDREGESISYHVAYILGFIDEKWPELSFKKNKSLDRIVFHEITPSALENALANPESLRFDLIKAQAARRILDRIVGYKISPLLWKKMGRNWLSAGRVQTVALRLIAEREKEISKFQIEKYYQVSGTFKNGEEFTAKLQSKNGISYYISTKITLFDGEYEFTKTTIDQKLAELIQADLKTDSFKIEKITSNLAQRFPPPPLTTSLLQQESFRRLRYPAKLTMRLAQTLYEKGLITYHRTDSFSLSSSYVFAAKDFIIAKYGKNYALEKPRGYRTKSKNAQEAHEAIRPTRADRTSDRLKKKVSPQEKKLYELIFNRALATQMKEAQVNDSLIQVKSGKGYEFEATHQEVVFDGFLLVLHPEFVKKNQVKLALTDTDQITLAAVAAEEKDTKPPFRYSEGTLIKALEDKGIGRPSTYASIITLILEKHYVEKDNRYFRPTPLGASISEYLSEAFPTVFGLAFTAQMENALDEVAQGKKDMVQILQDFYTPLAKELKEKEKDTKQIDVAEDIFPDEKCPKCGSDLIARFGKYGKFYACRGFPNCKYIKPNLRFVKGFNCPLCAGQIVIRYSRTGKRFYGCANYPTCKHMQWTLKVKS